MLDAWPLVEALSTTMPLVPAFSMAAALGAAPMVLAGVVMSYIMAQPFAAWPLTHLLFGSDDWLKNKRSVAPFLNSIRPLQPMPGFPGTLIFDEAAVFIRGGFPVPRLPVFLVNGTQ